MKKILSLIFFVFTPYFLFTNTVCAKDYSITNADFTVQINSDGSADVTEIRTYYFDGSFSWADEWLNLDNKSQVTGNMLGNYRIANFELWEGDIQYSTHSGSGIPRSYEVNALANKFYVKWYYEALNEKKTFILKYTIQNAIINHSDIAEFYWKLIGDEWTKGTGNVTAIVYLPSKLPSDRLWGFGHGPLNGKVSIPNNIQVDFSASNLPPKKFFEVRVLFEKLEGAINTQTGSSSLNKILAEEKAFGNKTRIEGIFKLVLLLLLVAIPLWRLIYWFFVWKRVGDDKPTPQVNLSGKLHEPPSDLEPALVEALSSWNMMSTSKSIVGTVLNLVRKKVLEIKAEKGKSLFGTTKYSYSLKIINMKYIVDEKLSEREKNLVNFLFLRKGKDEIKFSEIKNMGMTDRTSANKFWRDWQKKAVDELVDLGLLDPESKKAKDRFIVEMGILLIVSYLIIHFGGAFLSKTDIGNFVIAFAIGFVILFVAALILSPFMYKKSDKGLQEYANWKAFKSYIKDYSVTKNYPIDSVILWEKYLVYGATLGVSLKALSQMPINFPAGEYNHSGLYIGGMGNASMGYGVGGMGNAGISESFTGLSSVKGND
ncbi:MAG: putative membrane protein [Candidatus Woesebacteria bacterium GW2011_GWC1_38_13]|uniref:Putative membrane protein n=1 Tax=Candidatus Woesebacteria bacterium GW2011_GWC1_38_13 TaxID=1618583 RepID=A0A0G0IGY8_9BACT|nr:MAG: putative membrane protein [Candidatus Woesebacteria bacterium GW2011_GWC1_38_13]